VRERLKEPREGSEIEPEIMCVQGLGAPHIESIGLYDHIREAYRFYVRGDGVLFVERSNELLVHASVSHLTDA
jgi:uncharacterized protein involved in tellurium resistance